MNTAQKSQMTFQIDADLMQKFKILAVTQKKSMTMILIDYIKKICEESNNSVTLKEDKRDE